MRGLPPDVAALIRATLASSHARKTESYALARNREAAITPTSPFATFQVANALANSKDCLGLLENDFCFAVLSRIVERFSFIAELDNLRSLCGCNFRCWQGRIDFLDILRML